MAIMSTKSRYKEFGLVYQYEYSITKRNLDCTPERETVVTMDRLTSFDSDLTLINHTIKEGEDLHKLAYHYYNDARMWWFIADYNPLVDFNNLNVGDTLIIPPNTEVNAY